MTTYRSAGMTTKVGHPTAEEWAAFHAASLAYAAAYGYDVDPYTGRYTDPEEDES